MVSGKKGSDYERKLKKMYEMKGWYVMRSAGSFGPADLIAINPESRRIRVIQAKNYNRSISGTKEEQRILDDLNKKIQPGAYILENDIE